MTYHYVYMTTNLNTNKSYIGKHVGALDDDYLGSGVVLNQSIRKHGRDAFKKAILEVCTQSNINEREKFWISYYDATTSDAFYNLSRGGDGINVATRSDETKRRISDAMTGRRQSDETRRKISESMRGGKRGKQSAETRRKISEAMKGRKRGAYKKR